MIKKYYFGDKALSGFVRQKLNADMELSYKGVLHLFDSNFPIYISIEPTDKYVKGEKLFKVITYLYPMPCKTVNKKSIQIQIGAANRKRIRTIRNLEKLITGLGEAYEYQKSTEETRQREKCRKCKKAIEDEWRERLRKAVESNVARQREIRKRKIQKLLANRKRNK